jgi:signal transduction histidine kinase
VSTHPPDADVEDPTFRNDASSGRFASPLRRQILLPVAGLVLIAVLVNTIAAAWLASRGTAQAALERQQQMAQVLAEANYPRSGAVLRQLSRLTGDHYITWDARRGVALATSLPDIDEADIRLDLSRDSAGPLPAVQIGRTEYRASVLGVGSSAPDEQIVVLTSVERGTRSRWLAIWPALAFGGVTLLLLIPLTVWLSRRLVRRVQILQQHVEAIAGGDFGRVMGLSGPDDEVRQLADRVNQLSLELRNLRETVVHSERVRVLGQLAAGVAHQLRNGLTGARLAIQLHGRRCATATPDSSLQVALRQLTLLEEEVRGLLSLGRREAETTRPVDLATLLQSVTELVQPVCEHAGVRLEAVIPAGLPAVPGQRDALRAAMLNLTLNGIEAAGSGGAVRLSASVAADRACLRVEDSGAGPAGAVAGSLFEPFTTTKPEGLGLGLAIARQVAEDHRGGLSWSRTANRTCFELSWPQHESPHDEPDSDR